MESAVPLRAGGDRVKSIGFKPFRQVLYCRETARALRLGGTRYPDWGCATTEAAERDWPSVL